METTFTYRDSSSILSGWSTDPSSAELYYLFKAFLRSLRQLRSILLCNGAALDGPPVTVNARIYHAVKPLNSSLQPQGLKKLKTPKVDRISGLLTAPWPPLVKSVKSPLNRDEDPDPVGSGTFSNGSGSYL